MKNTDETKKHKERLKYIGDAITNPEVAKLYANGFIASFGNADMSLVFQRNGKPEAILNLSYTLAKTLSEKLLKMVKSLEDMTENEIMTTEFIDFRLEMMKKEPSLNKK